MDSLREKGNMVRVSIMNPAPDLETFQQIRKGEKKPDRVHFVEVLVDEEIKHFIIENVPNEKWVPAPPECSLGRYFL